MRGQVPSLKIGELIRPFPEFKNRKSCERGNAAQETCHPLGVYPVFDGTPLAPAIGMPDSQPYTMPRLGTGLAVRPPRTMPALGLGLAYASPIPSTTSTYMQGMCRRLAGTPLAYDTMRYWPLACNDANIAATASLLGWTSTSAVLRPRAFERSKAFGGWVSFTGERGLKYSFAASSM